MQKKEINKLTNNMNEMNIIIYNKYIINIYYIIKSLLYNSILNYNIINRLCNILNYYIITVTKLLYYLISQLIKYTLKASLKGTCTSLAELAYVPYVLVLIYLNQCRIKYNLISLYLNIIYNKPYIKYNKYIESLYINYKPLLYAL